MEGMQAIERGDIDAYERNIPPLLPDRHPDRDFFVCDILDAAPKDDLGSMEHPMFSLATKPDHRIRKYEHNGNSMTIAPGAHGLATIWDKDILIYCISQVVEGINRSRSDVSRTVWVAMCWFQLSGSYIFLCLALDSIQQQRIKLWLLST